MKNFAKRLISTLIIAAAIPCTVFAGIEKGNPKILAYTNYETGQIKIISNKNYDEMDAARAAQAYDLSVFINGTFADGINPIVVDGTALIPLEAVSEALDAVYEKASSDNSETIKKDSISLKFLSGSSTAAVNGAEKDMGAASVSKDSSLYVPARFLAENLGYDVKYNDASKSLITGGKTIFIDEKYGDNVISKADAQIAINQACEKLFENYKTKHTVSGQLASQINTSIKNLSFVDEGSRYYKYYLPNSNATIYFDKINGDMFYGVGSAFFYTVVDFDISNTRLFELSFMAG